MKTGNSRKMAALLSTAFMLGATGVTAFASNVTPPAQVQQAAGEQENESNEKADQAALAAQAQISEADAVAAAAASCPGVAFTVKELEEENGTLLYTLVGTDASGNRVKCAVNAMNGAVSTKTEDQENDAEDAAAQAALAAQAQISEANAAAAAAAANPGWSFVKSELDSKNGVIVYELKGTDAGGQKQEVTVNAIDGSIIQETEEND